MGFKMVKELVIFGNPLQAIIKANTESVTLTTKKIIDDVKNFSAVDEGTERNSIMGNLPNNKQYGFNDSSGRKSTFMIQTKPKTNHEAFIGTAQQAKNSNDIYGVYLEFGTRKMAPQPMFRPAIDKNVSSGSMMKTVLDVQREKMRGELSGGKQKRETFNI